MAAAPAPAAQTNLTLFVDGQPLKISPPAFVEDGTTMAPLHAVVKALGGGVQWAGRSVDITSHPKTFMASAVSGEAGPEGPVAPTIALTQYLAGMEAQTLRGSGPVLVRFDILDVRFDDVMVARLRGYTPRGYTYAVRLFYESVAGLPGLPPSAQQLYVNQASSGMLTGGESGPSPAHAFYEEATIEVVPSGALAYKQSGNTQTLTYGAAGWHADPDSLSISDIVVLAAPAELVHGAVPH